MEIMPFLWSSFIFPPCLVFIPKPHTRTRSPSTRWALGRVFEFRLGMRLTPHFHLVPGLRMGRMVPPFLRIPPWPAKGSNFTSTLRTNNRLIVIKFCVGSCFCCLYSFLRMHHVLPHVNLTFRHRASSIWDRNFATLQRMLFIYLINKYISLSDIFLTVHH